LAYIYKSKGTRSSIEFFLKFLGAPEPMIRINEFTYQVTSLPKSFDLDADIYDVIAGIKTYSVAVYNEETELYEILTTTGTTTLTSATYPVVEGSKKPKSIFDDTTNTFFQKGAGWYDITTDHRSIDVIDNENSNLTGRTKTIKTKNKSFTYGEDYFDIYRTLPGLDTGFEIESRIDNNQRQISDENSVFFFNRKNIEVYLSSANAVNYDIWRKSREYNTTGRTFGSATLEPQTGVTFAEFLQRTLSTQIRNSHTIKYRKNYIKLEDIYRDYITQTDFIPYYFPDVNEFIIKMSPYWMQVLDQVIPATTLWTGGNIIENNIFGRSKYKYRTGCEPKTFTEILYPDFEEVIEEDVERLLGEIEIVSGSIKNFRGLQMLTGVTYYPVFEIDGDIYSGQDSGNSIQVSGSALFLEYTGNSCGNTYTSSVELPLICDYKHYVEPDTNAITGSWKTELTDFIDNYVNEPTKKINYNFFTGTDGIEKIKFTSLKLGPNECSVNEFFDYRFVSEIPLSSPTCNLELDLSTDCSDYTGVTYNGTSPLGPTGCTLSSNVIIRTTGTTIQSGSTHNWPFYVYKDCEYV
jgi:hypothetical protein